MAEQKNKRITYPLSVQDVEELQALEKSLKAAADKARKAKKVGLLRTYIVLTKKTTEVVTRERGRMSRQELADLNRGEEELKNEVKGTSAGTPASPVPTSDGSVA